MDSSLSVWLVSTIGIANTIGRVVSGLVSSLLPNVDALLINNAALTIGGIVTIMSGFSLSFVYQIIYCSVFGLSMGKKECGHFHILLELITVHYSVSESVFRGHCKIANSDY